MLFLSPLIALMPEATIGGGGDRLTRSVDQPNEFSAILKVRRTEFFGPSYAFAGVVLLGN